MAKYEDRAEFKTLADVIVFHFLIGKTTLNGVLNWVKKSVFFLFKTIQKETKNIYIQGRVTVNLRIYVCI